MPDTKPTQLFKPLAGLKEHDEFTVRRPTNAVYKALNEVKVKAPIVEMSERTRICRRMIWDTKTAITSELSSDQYFAKVAEIIFDGFPKSYNADDIDIGEIQRAESFFVQLASGQS